MMMGSYNSVDLLLSHDCKPQKCEEWPRFCCCHLFLMNHTSCQRFGTFLDLCPDKILTRQVLDLRHMVVSPEGVRNGPVLVVVIVS